MLVAMILAIVFGLIAVAFVGLYCFQKMQTKRLTKQLEELNNEKRTQIVTMSFPTKANRDLVCEINRFLLEKEKTEQEWRAEEIRLQEMISNISHDMRTPLTAILGYMHLINSEKTSEDEREKYLTIVETRAKALQKLISDFYDMSRLNEGRYDFDMQKTDVNGCCLELLAQLYDSFEKDGMTVEANLLPAAPLCLADITAVRRIYENLFQNAKKHGGGKLIVASNIEEENLIVSISNESPFIGKEQIQRLFERSYTANESRADGNTGLGLSICKSLLEQMGHSIKADYQNGMFTIKIIWKTGV